MLNWDSLPEGIKNMARKYRDITIKPDFRYLIPNYSESLFNSYNKKDRDLKVGPVGLKHIIKVNETNKQTVCSLIPGNQHRTQWDWDKRDKKEMQKLMKGHFGYKFNPSGIFLINDGFFGWHTNEDKTMPRIYIVWVEKPNSSWFYLSKDGKNIKEKTEKEGWNVNCFQPPDWHSAKSDCIRFSMGFRQMEGERPVWEDLGK